MSKIYVCTGSCHGAVTEEQFAAGSTKCGTSSCDKFGQPFVAHEQCESCTQAAEHDHAAHTCTNCHSAA